jgi:hypothetical protein
MPKRLNDQMSDKTKKLAKKQRYNGQQGTNSPVK